MGRTKGKKRELAQDVHSLEGAVKKKRFPHPKKPVHQCGDQPWQKGSFRGSEESAAASLGQTEQRETCTEQILDILLHSPAWDTCLLVCMGAGGWNLGFRGQTWGEAWGWLCRNSLKGMECGLSHNRGFAQEGAKVCHWSRIGNVNPLREGRACLILDVLTAGTTLPLQPLGAHKHLWINTDIQGEIGGNTIIVGEFNTPLTSMDRSSRQKISKATEILNDTIE